MTAAMKIIQGKLQGGEIRSLIFDLDGVLIDSTRGVCDATNYALRRLGYVERETADVQRYIGSPLEEMFREFAPETPFSEIRPLFRERAQHVVISNSEALPGATETLARMRGAGFQIGIGSTKVRPHISGIIQRLGWEEYIDSYSGADEAPPKPAPDIFLKTLERMECAPENSLVIGDTANDTIAARRAGVSVVTIESSLGDPNALAENPADAHFPDLDAFSAFISDWHNS